MKSTGQHTRDIHIKGAREHNLKNIDVRIPRGKLVVITGVSGSGKSTLAFDTLYAEGYSKYIDSLSVKARQILDQVKRPEVDYIHGLSPVVAIEQRTGGAHNPRSTVATVTEIADYSRLLWSVCGQALCPRDGAAIVRRSIDDCIARIYEEPEGSRLMILAHWMKAKPSILRGELPRLSQRGFPRVRINGEIRNLDEEKLLPSRAKAVAVDIVVDRLVLASNQRSRLADSLELAFREGGDRAIILAQHERDGPWQEFSVSQRLACIECGAVYPPVTSRHFSYNHPDGACPQCSGMGHTRQFLDKLLVPDPEKSVRSGAIKPWRLGAKHMIIRRNAILRQLAEQLPYDPLMAWQDLDPEVRHTLLHGAGERLFSFKFARTKKRQLIPFAGVLADLEKTSRDTSSEGLRTRLMAYQVSQLCPGCKGKRLSQVSLAVDLKSLGFADFMALSVSESLEFIQSLTSGDNHFHLVADAVNGLQHRLRFLNEVGLGYLTLGREYNSLSGGESQRVRLATQLGMGLIGVIYVLDEPTIGLHAHDSVKLLQSLIDLRDRGNAVVVVEHDEETLQAADHLVELGPGAGAEGGNVVFEGSPQKCMSDSRSYTGPYLSGRMQIERQAAVCEPGKDWIKVMKAAEHNLDNLDISFPVGLLTCVAGVSGSGKSTLVNDILGKAAGFRLNRAKTIPGRHGGISGFDHFKRAVRVDQSPIGRSPRSNPATYIKLFDLLRQLYASCPLSRVRGYGAGRFSFNRQGGRCERCKGDGVIELDMQFMSDVYIECPSCRGNRYNRETLEVRFKGHNIADVLSFTVDEAADVFGNQPRLLAKLDTLQAVGMGYIRLGQPANTLSGGEAQRIKLALELSKRYLGSTLYMLDEPTTGLHWIDIQKLMDLLFKLRDAGNTIIVIEHHLDIIALADWMIDLGPGGGDAGGQLIFAGPPAKLLKCRKSITAQCLKKSQVRAKQKSAAI